MNLFRSRIQNIPISKAFWSSKPSNKKLTELFTNDLSNEFNSFYPEIRQIIIDESTFNYPADIKDRTIELLDYNLLFGKQIRGLTALATYNMLMKNDTMENRKLANILGWIPEIIQGSAIIWDDMMDNSTMRRNRLCWYKKDGLGLNAIADGVYLFLLPNLLLHQYFAHLPCFHQLNTLLLSVQMGTTKGQTMDVHCLKNGRPNFQLFSLERFLEMVELKTTTYTFYLPVVSVMYLTNMFDDDVVQKVKNVLYLLGIYIQVQDDYMDCFADEAITGKQATDIADGKCSWLAVKALEKCSKEERQVMDEFYGKADSDAVERVKLLYRNLGLKELYAEFEESMVKEINAQIEMVPHSFPQDLFHNLIKLLYKREK